jgi:hypothetical protein
VKCSVSRARRFGGTTSVLRTTAKSVGETRNRQAGLLPKNANLGISGDFSDGRTNFQTAGEVTLRAVLSHAVTYLQTIAAAWLFDETRISFRDSTSKSDPNVHIWRIVTENPWLAYFPNVFRDPPADGGELRRQEPGRACRRWAGRSVNIFLDTRSRAGVQDAGRGAVPSGRRQCPEWLPAAIDVRAVTEVPPADGLRFPALRAVAGPL